MSRKWSEWLLPGGLLCICTMLAEDMNATEEMYEADGLYASGMDFQFMGEKVKMRLVGSFLFLSLVVISITGNIDCGIRRKSMNCHNADHKLPGGC